MTQRLLFASGLVSICIALMTSCLKPPDYDEVPVIEFVSLSKSVVQEATLTSTDSLLLTFSFTDGDGNLGASDDQDTMSNVFLTDSRDNSTKFYQVPNLTPEGNVKAISGEVSIAIGPFTCSAGVDSDVVVYTIVVKDR